MKKANVNIILKIMTSIVVSTHCCGKGLLIPSDVPLTMESW